MSPSEYQYLIELLAKKFDRIDERFDGVDGRLEGLEKRMVRVEVGQESLRTDVQTIAELVTANGRRIDENRRAIESLSEKVDLNTVGIRAVRDRVADLEDHLRAV